MGWELNKINPRSTHLFFDHREHFGSMWPYTHFGGLPFHNCSSSQFKKILGYSSNIGHRINAWSFNV